MGVAAVVVVVLCYSLVPAYGAVGAALSVSGIYIVLATTRVGVYMRHTGAKLPEVLVFQKSDLLVYQNVLRKIISHIHGRKRVCVHQESKDEIVSPDDSDRKVLPRYEHRDTGE